MAKPVKRRRKIALVGDAGSGKTVLLTSLINHLQYHDADKLRLGRHGNAEIRHFRLLPAPGAEAFPYEAYRDALVHAQTWPAKTRDSSHCVCKLERTDHRWSEYELHFFDFPGERIADVAVAAHEEYASWSDHVLGYLESTAECRRLAAPFLGLLSEGPTEERALLHHYKLALASFVLGYKTMVSPSTFLLDTTGRQPAGKSPAELAANGIAGLRADPEDERAGEFAPLPAALRDSQPELAALLAARYGAYRERVVMPLFEQLKHCQQLVVLGDVATVLGGGTARFNDTVRIAEDLFGIIEGRGALARLLAWFSRSARGLDRVAFVAPKLDLVAIPDRSRFRGLLQAMLRHVSKDLDIDVEWFSCSAVVSTQAIDPEQRRLVGRLVWSPDGSRRLSAGDRRREYDVPEVPEQWPEQWPERALMLPPVHPVWPANRVLVPEQIELGRLFDFLCA